MTARAGADATHMSLASRLVIVTALAAAVVAAAVALGPRAEPTAAPSTTSAPFAGIRQDGIALGSAKAPAVLTEFADLQCPYCATYARDVLPTIVDRYVRTGRLRLELHVLSFLGEDSVRAGSMAAAATEQDRLWTFADAFYRSQGPENSGYATDDFLRRIGAETPGLDVERAFDDRARTDVLRRLDDARREATALGVDYTPAFVIQRRGGPPRGLEPSALTPEAFVAALDDVLATRCAGSPRSSRHSAAAASRSPAT